MAVRKLDWQGRYEISLPEVGWIFQIENMRADTGLPDLPWSARTRVGGHLISQRRTRTKEEAKAACQAEFEFLVESARRYGEEDGTTVIPFPPQ
jgi:hypothetical protein